MKNPLTGEQINLNDGKFGKHINSEFPVSFYTDWYKSLGSCSYFAHWQAEIEVILAVKGDIEVACNEEVIKIKEGDALFINSNILNCVLHDDYPDSIIQSIIFNPTMIYGFHSSDIEKLYVLPITNGDHPYIYIKNSTDSNDWGKKCIDALSNAIRFNALRKDGYKLGIQIMLLDSWYILYRNIPKSDVIGNTFSPKVLFVKNAISFITENYMKDITLDDISNSSLLSKSELCKLFRKYVNQSPIQYLLRYRILTACFYIANTDSSITDIANTVGIPDPNYFAISFKKIMNMAPTAFRHSMKNMKQDESSPIPFLSLNLQAVDLY